MRFKDMNCNELYLLKHDENDTLTGNEDVVYVNTQFHPYDSRFELVGSCNGLVCLSDSVYYDPICVGNPITGEYMSLPSTGKSTNFDIVSGIGFDQVTNQYKVIRMMYDYINYCDQDRIPFKLKAMICTLGLDKEWRNLGDVPYPLLRTFENTLLTIERLSQSSQVFVNGALHWMMDEEIATLSTNVSDRIVAFDVAKEEFQLISNPPISFPNVSTLGELGGYLCLFVYLDDRCEIWIMKEYGVKGSWTKEYIIPRQKEYLLESRIFVKGSYFFRPIKLMKNGNILLNGNIFQKVTHKCLASYDPAAKVVSELELPSIPPFSYAVTTHVQSLVSLKDILESTNR